MPISRDFSHPNQYFFPLLSWLLIFFFTSKCIHMSSGDVITCANVEKLFVPLLEQSCIRTLRGPISKKERTEKEIVSQHYLQLVKATAAVAIQIRKIQ